MKKHMIRPEQAYLVKRGFPNKTVYRRPVILTHWTVFLSTFIGTDTIRPHQVYLMKMRIP
jgi:hypothetical protein